MKNIHLHRNVLSKEAIAAMASDTLRAGGLVEVPPPEPQIGDYAAPRIGAVMKDGTVFAGISPDTNKPMYAMPSDAPLTMAFNAAKEYATNLHAHGHKDWRVPSKAELNVLFNNRAAIGGFDISGSYPAGWYWSASPSPLWGAWGQRFSDGRPYDTRMDGRSPVRCVR